MSLLKRFEPKFSAPAWAALRSRIRQTRWQDPAEGSLGTAGLDRELLIELCSYWSEHFDWQQQMERFSRLPHFRFESTAGGVHFVYVKGNGPSPSPLLITHGWPGSFLEMLKIMPLLTDPVAHGLSSAISFDVVVPSLPGFGYSDRPHQGGMNVFRIAKIWVDLMEALGYSRFAVQGGDLGAAVSTALGLRHSSKLLGVHLNYIPGSYRPYFPQAEEPTPEERAFISQYADWYDRNGAYAHLLGTRPKTVAYALNDSPAGLAAWIVEKYTEWSDSGGDLYRVFSRDELLTNVTLYWMTETIGPSFRMYEEGRRVPLHFSPADYVQAPCAVAVFPKEILMPPRSYVERGYNVQQWTAMERGGHFAAAEQPRTLAADIQAFFGRLLA